MCVFYRKLISGKRRYNIKLWKTFTDCFNCLPVAAIIDEKIFCCHGGLSPDLQSMEQIRRLMRPTDVPDQGLLCDLLWSDPDKVLYLFRFFIVITLNDFRMLAVGGKTIAVYLSHLVQKLCQNSCTNMISILFVARIRLF